ncbi:MAG: hypothetical protein ACFE95_13730 [Candidatus Hodarchaeota archaeon]
MDRKLTRTTLLIIMMTVSTFIGGIFAFKSTIYFFHSNSTNCSKLDNDEMFQIISQNYSRIGIRSIQGCCGHTDVTPPSITLISPRNETIILNSTIIVL